MECFEHLLGICSIEVESIRTREVSHNREEGYSMSRQDDPECDFLVDALQADIAFCQLPLEDTGLYVDLLGVIPHEACQQGDALFDVRVQQLS